MKKTTIETLTREDALHLIGKEWMLVTAGTPENFNTMTASWGGIGWLWNKPVAFVFVRPERHTFGFVEREERFTLSFLGEEHRDILNFCGTKSGRDCDKIAATLQCRKLFRSPMKPEEFLDKACLERWYNDRPGGSMHVMYVAEIEAVFEQ